MQRFLDGCPAPASRWSYVQKAPPHSNQFVVALAHKDPMLHGIGKDGTYRCLQGICEEVDALRFANAERLEYAVRLARDIFSEYARLHEEKGTPDGADKAKTNRKFAFAMAQALALEVDLDAEPLPPEETKRSLLVHGPRSLRWRVAVLCASAVAGGLAGYYLPEILSGLL